MKALVISLLLIFSSCAFVVKKVDRVYIDDLNFNDSMSRSAFDQVVNILNHEPKHERVSFEDQTLRKVSIKIGQLEKNVLGECSCDWDNSCLITINSSLKIKSEDSIRVMEDKFRETKLVILHELGHAFGYKHSDRINNIMNGTLQAQPFTNLNFFNFDSE